AWRALAAEAGCTPAQLALTWLLSRGEHVVPIPGTTNAAHLRENQGGLAVPVDPALLARAGDLIDTHTVSGPRYNATGTREVDAEVFDQAVPIPR
ncbi:MAG TPA: aldo/keto reductase, partial [Microbacterium sp.]|nr:aldo/keto reductase [Microbacterium sp.]